MSAQATIPHGTPSGYSYHRCRCDVCRTAWRRKNRAKYHERMGDVVKVDRDRLSDLLNELFPMGLTDDCPARRSA